MKLVPLLIFFLSISLIALDDKAAKKIEDVYTALLLKDESGESAPDNETALRILTELRINSSNLKSFERSAMWEAWGYLYYINNDYFSAIDAYTRLIEEPGTENEKKTSTLLTLAQLNYLVKNFESGIKFMLQWMSEADILAAKHYLLLGQMYFEVQQFDKAKENFRTAAKFDDKLTQKNANDWLQYTENEEIRVTNLALHGKKKDGSYSYIPIYKVMPVYPRRAQERGTEGYVIVAFTITESGTIEDPYVIEGKCRSANNRDGEYNDCSMFNSATIRAALKLKYAPEIMDGKAVAVEDVQHKFSFEMEN